MPNGAKAARGARRDILKQIDSDLLAVEEALNRRRQSLAEIDRKLSELQLPDSNSGASTSRGAEASSVLSSPQASSGHPTVVIAPGGAAPAGVSAAPTAAVQGGQAAFSEWLQEHKDFCTGIQHARRDQENQERTWQHRRQLLQSQLSLLQSQLQTSCRTLASTSAVSTNVVPGSIVGAAWSGPQPGRSVSFPAATATFQPHLVHRAHSWSVPTFGQMEAGSAASRPQSSRGPRPPLPGRRRSVVCMASAPAAPPISASGGSVGGSPVLAPSAHIAAATGAVYAEDATPVRQSSRTMSRSPPRARARSEPRGPASVAEDLLLTRVSTTTQSARSTPMIRRPPFMRGAEASLAFMPGAAYSVTLPSGSPRSSPVAAVRVVPGALTARTSPVVTSRVTRARTVSPTRQSSPVPAALLVPLQVANPTPLVASPPWLSPGLPGCPAACSGGRSLLQLSVASQPGGSGAVPVAPVAAAPAPSSVPLTQEKAADAAGLAAPVGLPHPVLNVPLPPLLQEPLEAASAAPVPKVTPPHTSSAAAAAAYAAVAAAGARQQVPWPGFPGPSVESFRAKASRGRSRGGSPSPPPPQASPPPQVPPRVGATSPAPLPQQVPLAPAPMPSFDIAKSPTIQVSSSFEAPPPPPPPPGPQNHSFEPQLTRVPSSFVAPLPAAAGAAAPAVSGSCNGGRPFANGRPDQVPNPRNASFATVGPHPATTAGPVPRDMSRCLSMEYPLPPQPPSAGEDRNGLGARQLSMLLSPPPPPPVRASGGPGDFPVARAPSSFSSSCYPQSFSEVNLGSFAEGLEQWKPPPSIGSFQLRTEAAFAPIAATRIEGPNATYTGPQQMPRGQPQCPVQ